MGEDGSAMGVMDLDDRTERLLQARRALALAGERLKEIADVAQAVGVPLGATESMALDEARRAVGAAGEACGAVQRAFVRETEAQARP